MSWNWRRLSGREVNTQNIFKLLLKVLNVHCLIVNFPKSVCSAEGPDPCELAQNPRYRKGPEMCFDNNENVRNNRTCAALQENIAGNSSISEVLQLASVNFCLVLISIGISA